MQTTTELKEYAQLAQASYALLNTPLIYGDETATQTALENSPNGAFSEGEAVDFTNHYRVLNQFRDSGTLANGGFSATLFQDKNDPSRLVLSFAGTEFETDVMRDGLLTDAQIGFATRPAAPRGAMFGEIATNTMYVPALQATASCGKKKCD
jgi:hypothetical protein